MFISRALNHSRREFLPTYVGLRLILESLPRQISGSYLKDLVERKAFSGKRQSYRTYQMFKTENLSGELEYRTCSAASPTCLLVESYALGAMAADPCFTPPPFVYSYHWAHPKSAHLYRYYFSGYIQRNADISSSLSSFDSEACVVMMDLKAFYPSVDQQIAKRKFDEALGRSDLRRTEKKVAEVAAAGLFSASRTGLPVGPPLSHALANLCLAEIDKALFGAFPNRYFRYVDDVAIITSRADAEKVAGYVEAMMSDHGYKINRDKTQIIDSRDQLQTIDSADGEFDFGTLREAIVIYLTVWPSSSDALRRVLSDSGFNLPITYFSRGAMGKGWQEYISALLNYGPSSRGFKLAFAGTSSILRYAMGLRRFLRTRLEAEASSHASGKEALRRINRLINVLLYLYRPEDLNELLPFVPVQPETKSLRSLLKACSSGEVGELLWYPGRTVSTFAQLWSEAYDRSLKVEWPAQLSPAQRDAASILSLTGVVELPEQLLATAQTDEGFLRFCAESPASEREFQDFSYEDEVRSLQIGTKRGRGRDLLQSRFDKSESLLVEGLNLRTDVYS